MHRDKRIGLGLGILLVGVVGALFFRREPADKTNAPPPPLESAKELNKQIAEKPTSPYIVGGPEEFLATAPPPPVRQPQAKTEQTPEAYRRPKFLEDSSDAFTVGDPKRAASDADRTPKDLGARESSSADPAHERDDESANPARDHQPITVGTIEVPAPIPVRADNHTSSAATAGSSSIAQRDPSSTPNATRTTHMTKPGETLSSIAAKYLGSSVKYNEIYEANKDVLRSPDVVPEGVTLIIPKAGSTKPTTPAATAPRTEAIAVTQTEPTTTPRSTGTASPPVADSGRLKFEPVRRSPFAAGRTPKSQSSTSAGPSSSSSVIEEAPSLNANGRSGPVDLLRPEIESGDNKVSHTTHPRTYKIQHGDTLEAISLKFYGVRGKSEDLFKANRDKLASPNALREGLEIVVP